MTFNLIDSRPGQAARVLDGLKRINAYAASEQHGASLREIEAVHKAVVARAGFTDGKAPSDDLISMLISDPDNKDLWETQLLGSQFAKDMLAVTGSLDENFNAVLEGFKAYMIQDYLYSISEIKALSERLHKATSAQDININLDAIVESCKYSKDVLRRCLDSRGLAIQEKQLVNARPTDDLKKYIQDQLDAAKNNEWVIGLVAIIPCVVSQCTIAKELCEDPTMIDWKLMTPWYKNWIEPNGKIALNTIALLRSFFIANCDHWKCHYEDAKKSFQTACQGEINLWKYAEEQKNAAAGNSTANKKAT
ncbi:hypothetical protein FOMPIDRAFT_99461 [Fomitopsis schrenkii]|uniref:Thiaminase-2/PQQC domain-containing protein n=1 Tax=Fomitopsis schrenkii TaxID=2126942 RepID=S8EFX1_FOMSC|nr:hypothetical protein FOMPIDRAFT_99461 [Fomitopsis schrenkii]